MDPASILTGLALARNAINFVKENLDSANDAKAIGEQIFNIFKGHQEFQKKRFSGGIKDVATEMIELKIQEQQMYDLSVQVDMRFGNGFFQSIRDEYNRRVKAQKEQDRLDRIARRKQMRDAVVWAGVLSIFGITGLVAFMVWVALNR